MVRLSVGPILLLTLRLFCGGKWILRHSSTEPGAYNIFFSDYDLTLLIEPDWSDQKLAKTLEKFKILKSFLILLGEVEVYFESEWVEKKNLLKNHGALILQVRDLRKIRWMKEKFLQTTDKYHRAKALRGIKFCRKKIKGRRDHIQTLLKEGPSSPVPFFETFYSDFYQCYIKYNAKNTSALLMSMTSLDKTNIKDMPSDFRLLRNVITKFEFIEHTAYQREQMKCVNPQTDWLRKLIHLLKEEV